MASSNIIGAGFEDYVKTQIRTRQEKLGLSLKDQEVYNFTNSNAPFIRLTSGVNVEDNILTQLGLQNNDLYKGNGLAYYNKLYGGRSIYIESLTPPKGKLDALTSGYGYYDGTIGQYPTSYGFYSNADYGLVPPPGIKSIDVKAMNRGSLREATIQIQCHNLQQFKIIEILYMRLKYSILLEWGHSMYFDNDGIFRPASTWDLSKIFLNGGITQQGILDHIESNREGSCGNYDAFFGLVTNFNWTLRPDGGYDITVIARSVGDVIESLKINVNYPTQISGSAPSQASAITANAYKTSINKILYSLTTQIYPGRGYAHGVDYNNEYLNTNGVGTSQTPIHNGNLEWMSGDLKSVFNRTADFSKAGDYLTWNEAWCFEFSQLTEGSTWGRQYYIKLGTLLRILESFLLVYDTEKGSDKYRPPLFKIDYNYNTNHCFTFPRQCSLDPKVCLIPIDKNVTGSGAISGYAFKEKTYDFMEVYEVNDTNGNLAFRGNSFLANNTLNLGSKWGSLVVTNETSPQPTSISPGSTIQVYGPAGAYSPENLSSYVEATTLKIGAGGDPAKTALIELYDFGATVPKNPITVVDGQPYVTNYGSKTQDLGEKYFDYNSADINPKDLGYRTNPVEISRDEYFRKLNIRKSTYPGFDYYAGYDLDHVRAYYRRITVKTFFDLSSAYTSGAGGSSNIYDLLKDTNFKTDGLAYRGNTMHMYVNLSCIVDILDKNVNISTGEISLYDFLDTLMKKIQNALGNVNNFQIIYNEDTNSYRIIDNTFIPGTVGKDSRFKIASFNANILKPNYGSFIENVNFKSKLSNNFATMTTIGAQKNGNVVGSNSTALSKWNTGLTDRIISRRDNSNADTGKPIEQIYRENIVNLKTFNGKVNDKSVSDQDVSNIRGAIGDIFNAQIGEYTNDPKANFPGIGFIPFDLELTMLGLSGPRIYESYTIDTTLLPDVYKDKVQFICSGVSHHVDENGWKTTLNSICGPRYEGVTVEQPAPADNLPVVVVNTTPVKSDWVKPASFLGASATAFVGKDWKKYDIEDVVKKIQANTTLKTSTFENYLRTVLRAIKNDPNIEEVEDAAYILATGKKEANYSLIRWESDYLCVPVGQPYLPPTPAGVASDTNGPCRSAKNYYRKASGRKVDYYTLGTDSNGLPYFGRGLIQLTGKGTYDKYGKIIGVDLVANPELLFSSDEIAYNAAIAYMVTKKTFKWARLGDGAKARATVNGDGDTDVWKYYLLLKPILENAVKTP